MKPAKSPKRLPEAEIAARVINNFVVKHRKARFLTMVAKPNNSGGYGFGELAHFTSNLDLRFCHKIPSGSQYDAYVLKEIQSLTSSTECYIMHESPELDGQWLNLADTLSKILGRNLGAFVIIDNGDIIYYESENIKERYLCKLPQ
ncbi:MAG: hypothetical protein ACRYFX_31300 [Janthinobacterium lividum]